MISRKDGNLAGARWDLNDVDNWRMGVLSRSDIEREASPDLLTRDGTEVIWSDCDRLSEGGELKESEFNALVVHARGRIALTFHKYLSGKVPGKKLEVRPSHIRHAHCLRVCFACACAGSRCEKSCWRLSLRRPEFPRSGERT